MRARIPTGGLIAIVAFTGLAIACAGAGEGGGPSPEPASATDIEWSVPEDAADAPVVESPAPEWGPDGGWAVEETPALSIGVDEGEEPYMLHRVGGVLRLDDGTLLVSNSGTHEVRFFDDSGRFLRRVGRLGQGPAEFSEFSSMRLWLDPEGRVLVADSGGFRLNVFDTEGEYLTTVSLEPVEGMPRPFLRGIFGDGTWLVYGARGGGGMRPEEPGRIITNEFIYFRYREGVSVGELLRMDGRSRSEHRFGEITHFPYLPLSADPLVHPGDGRLFVLRGERPQVEVRDLQGDVLALWRWAPDHVRPTEEIWDRYRTESLASTTDEETRARYEHYYDQDPPRPEVVPTYQEMLTDAAGNLWLERFRLPWDEAWLWDVVGPEGEWLGTVEVAAGFTPHQIDDDRLVGVHRDEMGVEQVRVYRLVK